MGGAVGILEGEGVVILEGIGGSIIGGEVVILEAMWPSSSSSFVSIPFSSSEAVKGAHQKRKRKRKTLWSVIPLIEETSEEPFLYPCLQRKSTADSRLGVPPCQNGHCKRDQQRNGIDISFAYGDSGTGGGTITHLSGERAFRLFVFRGLGLETTGSTLSRSG